MLLEALIISIPKNPRGDLCSSDNYRGIALSSAIAKLFDIIVLNRYGSSHLSTSELQFAYKTKHSTSMCTFVLKEIIHYYWSKQSNVFTCFVDASKAFDKVSFEMLFLLLLKKNIPAPFVRLIFDGYLRQKLSAVWNQAKSGNFCVANGVRQGAVLSAILYIVYTDELLERLQKIGAGCYVESKYYGAVAYADDLTLISPTLEGLEKMVSVTESFGNEFSIEFNAVKTKCMAFSHKNRVRPILHPILVSGREIEWVDNFKYLGNWLTPDLSDTFDIEKKRGHFVQKANHVLHAFSIAKSSIKSNLVQTFCTALYGSQLWKLNNRVIDKVRTAWNIVQRCVWRLSRKSHSKYLPILARSKNLLTQVHSRTRIFLQNVLVCDNSKVRDIAQISLNNELSITYINMNFLDNLNQESEVNENDIRLCYQIIELNECLDGERACGLNEEQIRRILSTISEL